LKRLPPKGVLVCQASRICFNRPVPGIAWNRGGGFAPLPPPIATRRNAIRDGA
jgi:hypothetical protein